VTDLDKELSELVKEQEILRGMKASCNDFEKKINDKIAEFCEKHFGLKKDASFSLLDIISGVRSK
jgi:hypothetical protein